MSRARDLANLGNNASGLETLTVSDITDITATASELNTLDGVTATKDELNLVDGSVTGPLSHRNLIINGAMQVAQRGTSSTSSGMLTVDRFATTYNHNNEDPTQSQHALTSSDTGPYEEGFRNSFHILNGNNSSDNNDDRVAIIYKIEAQDLAKSGWDYKSSSSYITLSFWCKSSVAQNFYGRLQTKDGTEQGYAFETGSLTANTWTKITKTIPGNSNLDFNDDNGEGLVIEFVMFRGTDKTGPMSLDTWGAYNSAIRVPDMTSTWYTTNDATWEITGLQLERGSVATPFEHRSYADEIMRCYRYYQQLTNNTGSQTYFGILQAYNGSAVFGLVRNYIIPMRVKPHTVESDGTFYFHNPASGATGTQTGIGNLTAGVNEWLTSGMSSGSGLTAGHASILGWQNGAYITADAEL